MKLPAVLVAGHINKCGHNTNVAGQELVQEGPANKAAKPPTKTTCEVRDAEYKQNALQQALTTAVRVKDHSENSIDLGSLVKLMSKENVHLKNGRYYKQPQSLSLRSGLVALAKSGISAGASIVTSRFFGLDINVNHCTAVSRQVKDDC